MLFTSPACDSNVVADQWMLCVWHVKLKRSECKTLKITKSS